MQTGNKTSEDPEILDTEWPAKPPKFSQESESTPVLMADKENSPGRFGQDYEYYPTD